MNKILYCVVVYIFIIGCNSEYQPKQDQEMDYFFPVTEFMKADFTKYRASNNYKKIITVNGKVDSLTVTDTLKPSDLYLFEQYHINNAKWIDKYIADTTYGVYGDPDRITYKATEESLPVRTIEVNLEAGKVIQIKGVSRRKSLINKYDQELIYYPAHGYDLTSNQKSWTGDTISMHVKVLFQ